MKKSDHKNQRRFSRPSQPQAKTSSSGSELDSLVSTEHIVKIEKMIVGGDGLARIQHLNKSLVVFVPLSAPDDELKIRITSADKNFLKAEIIENLKPSSRRTAPKCEYFGNCGGCNWQHISAQEQLHQKEQILKDLFAKFLPQATYSLLPSIESESLFNYRNRIQLKQFENQVGYFKRGTHEIVSIKHCELAEEKISDEIKHLSSKLRPSKELKKFEVRLNQKLEIESYPIGEDGEGLSFSQVNNSVNIRLVDSVVGMLKEIKPLFITELYAGAGNFTFPIAAALPDVRIETAELNSKLTTFAQSEIIKKNLQKRVLAFTSDCESFSRRRALSEQLVLLDPPRAGCSEQVINKLIESKPENIIYISCHPAYLSRDLKKILSAHPQYSLEHVQIFNMFPQTDHFETLVRLKYKFT